MSLSMYQASIPAFTRALNNLSAILAKGAAYAAAKKIDETVLTSTRLYPDMLPFSRQVQIASDIAKAAAARLAGVEVPSFPDTETNFDELQTRIKKTIAFIESFKPAQIDGSEKKPVTFKTRGQDTTLEGQSYLFNFVLPNIHFHTAIAYGLLRHNGVELGKADFIGAL